MESVVYQMLHPRNGMMTLRTHGIWSSGKIAWAILAFWKRKLNLVKQIPKAIDIIHCSQQPHVETLPRNSTITKYSMNKWMFHTEVKSSRGTRSMSRVTYINWRNRMEKQVNTDIYLHIIITRITKRFPVESVRCRDGSGINVHKKGKGCTNPTYHPV